MKYQALLFDLDGTLIDSLADIILSINKTRAAFDLPPLTDDQITPHVGYGLADLLEQTFPEITLPVSRIVEIYRPVYRKVMLHNTRLFDGITALLGELKHRDLSLFLVTNKSEEPSHAILEKLGIHGFFQGIAGGDTYHARKPDPVQIVSLLKDAKINPERALMAGDHENDILAAHAAGCGSVYCTWGFGTPGNVSPHYRADSPEDILSFL